MLLRGALLTLALLSLPISLLWAQGRPVPQAGPTSVDAGADSARLVVVGVVFDSVAKAPLAGAMVQLVPHSRTGPVYSAVADSAGSPACG